MMWRMIWVWALVALMWGCGPTTSGNGAPCEGPGCHADGGTRPDDGHRPDPALPTCGGGGACAEGACVEGVCCPGAQVCGSSCCGGAEVCFANACVVPGAVCTSAADCGAGQRCELAFGDANVLCGDMEIETGRCVALPPRCDGVASGRECIEACEYRPPVDVLSAVELWAWDESSVEQYPDAIDVWSTPTVGRLTDSNCDGLIDAQDRPNVVFVSGQSSPGQCAGRCMDPAECACDVPAGCDAATGCECAPGTGAAGMGSACRRGVLRMLDGVTGRELWSLRRPAPDSRGFAGLSIAIGDVVGDERMDIVTLSGEGHVVVLDADGNVVGTSDEPVRTWDSDAFGWGGALALADADGDGDVEVAYRGSVFTIGRSGTITSRFLRGGTPVSVFANVDADADLELLSGRTAYELDETVIWQHPPEVIAGGAFPAVGDLDGDGRPEVVLVGLVRDATVGRVWVVEAATGVVELGPVTLGEVDGSGGPPTLADFDGDGEPEIGVAQAENYFVFEPDYQRGTLRELWRAPNHDMSSSVTGSTVFDFEGDGVAEVIYNDECFLWVYDGPTGRVRFATPTSSFTANEASIVADVDGDGHANILVGANGADARWGCTGGVWAAPGPNGVRPGWTPPPGRSFYRGLRAFRDSANSWVGTRALWNQHSYHVSNVCAGDGDLCPEGAHAGAVPRAERSSWSVPWLNSYRQNVQGEGIFKAPDAVLDLAMDCRGTPRLVAAVRNLGEAILPVGAEVGFFQVESAEERLIGRSATETALFPGQATEVSLELSGADIGLSYVARVLIDATSRTFHECREDNNASLPVVASCLE